MIAVQLQQISIPPGQHIVLKNINWQKFENILLELGESRSSRIYYYQETLELMTPLPEHERIKVILSDLIKVLLDELNMNWESLGSTTFKREDMQAGVEPDDCFYIQNYEQVIGKNRIDLTIDSPPDLVLEIDLTSKTQINAYQSLKVPEIWIYDESKLEIYCLQNEQYILSQNSIIFPDFPIQEAMIRFLKMSQSIGTTQTLKQFRNWIRSAIN
ncbi:Uma2 family endonuclease [Crocosphaera sp.]|uniref:Uma2 family endonuclease n=1 Tax=Crocosphaera sp. TaxID=2729996 RepID=UPI002624849E|nr:Uma2 family endonuclease [Crocosphaera sp.]MDJ0578856.1 Uma2 family endonuclease [Crocosphaera sp.]